MSCQPTPKRRKRSNDGFEIFVCELKEGSDQDFVFAHAEKLRGLGVKDIACSGMSPDPAFVLTADMKVKQWGTTHAPWIRDLQDVNLEKSLIDERTVQVVAGSDLFGDSHYVAVGQSGAVYSWGEYSKGQLGHGNVSSVEPKKIEALKDTDIVQVSACKEITVFLSNKGEVYTCGNGDTHVHGISDGNQLVPRLAEGLKGKQVTQISAALGHVAAITDQFDLFTWGVGTYGRLGHSDENNRSTPKLVQALRGKAMQVSCGWYHTGVIAEGGLYTFGNNQDGQLGHGDQDDRSDPTLVTELGNSIQHVSCGYNQTACVSDGALFTWGQRQLSPKKVESLKDYHVSHVCLLKNNILAFIDPCYSCSDIFPVASTFASMINNQDVSDVSFLVEDQKVFALKAILVKRCPIFKTMFESGMSESSNQHNIPVSGVRKEIFLLMLEFLYSDTIIIGPEDVIDLYVAADMYMLSHLKSICLGSLEESLHVKNVTFMLEKAASCGYEEPKALCMKFLVENMATVAKTDGFKQLRDPDLLHEIIAATND